MSEDKKDENIDSSNQNEENTEKVENQPSVDENLDNSPNENQSVSENQEKNDETAGETKNETTEHQVIHKKDGRLHIYVRQDKYKGELKSKNWVGRLYIDGKQKISSSGTQNLDEAIPILEKWFDDIHAESEKLKKLAEEEQQIQKTTGEQQQNQPIVQEQPDPTVNVEEKLNPTVSTETTPKVSTQNLSTETQSEVNNDVALSNEASEKTEDSVDVAAKGKVSNILGKFKNLKFKKSSLKGIKLPKSPVKNNSLNKILNFFKSKIGKSSIKGEEVIGVELTNKEIRLAQINSDKSNQWVLEKFYIHKIDIPDESSVLENAEKVTTELNLALQKSKIGVGNVAISIPVTSAIIRVVTSPLMKDEELQKAIETNSLWENLVQLTDNLDDYSIFHQVINRN